MYNTQEKLAAQKVADEFDKVAAAALLIFFVNFDNDENGAVNTYNETVKIIVNQLFNHCCTNDIVASELAMRWFLDCTVQHKDIVNEYVNGTWNERELTRAACINC